MPATYLLLALSTLLCLTSAASGQLQLPGDDRKALVSLIAETRDVQPGDQIAVGVQFEMQPNWHIYWKNPGDAGQAPRFSWTTTLGTVSEPLFPAPKAFTQGGLVGYGYSGTIVFPAILNVPQDVKPGRRLDLAIDVQYLVCDDAVCVPEQATATLRLNVADAGSRPAQDDASLSRLADAMASLPMEADDPAAPTMLIKGTEVVVRIPADATDIGLFPDPPANVVVEPGEVRVSENNTTLAFTARILDESEANLAVPAVVAWTNADGQRRGINIDLPVTP
jgi:DsbC/DsbD-like thiol-disulfide interchange protein